MMALCLILLLAGAFATGLEAQGCDITNASASHNGQVSLGTHIVFSGNSTCGTVKFTVNGQSYAEIGSTSQTWTMRTEEFGTGGFEVCFVARGEGGWENARRTCWGIYVQGSQGQPPNSNPGGSVRCWVTQFTVTPATVAFGGTFQFAGYGQCDGNARAARFYIDGNPWGEFGGNTTSASWNTSGYGAGSHEICFGITAGEWSQEARSCTRVTIAAPNVTPTPAAIQGPPADNGQPGQTDQSGPGGVYNPTQVPSSGSSSPSISQAQQSGNNGGVDLITVCYAYGYTGAGNSDNTENGWYCSRGNETWRVDWDRVCRDVYGSNYHAVRTGGMNGIRCQRGSSSSSSSSSGGSSGGGNAGSNCPSSPATVVVGDQVSVIYVDGSPLNLRQEPDLSAHVITTIPVGERFTIIGGSTCNDGWRWWNAGFNGQQGYVGEVGPQRQYNFRGSLSSSNGGSSNSGSSNGSGSSGSGSSGGSSGSFDSAGRAQICANVPNRLTPGMHGRNIVDGRGPTSIRQTPGGHLIAEMPEGTEFDVIGGPECLQADSGNVITWIRVNVPGYGVGWSPEATNSTYNLEPWTAGSGSSGGSGGSSGSGSSGSGSTISPVGGDTSGATSGNARYITWETVQLSDGTSFSFQYDWDRNWILNGSEFVVSELIKVDSRLAGAGSLTDPVEVVFLYAIPVVGESDRNVRRIRDYFCNGNSSCESRIVYLVGDRLMDLSGVGNIAYGYYIDRLNLPLRMSDAVAGWDQLISSIRAWEYITTRDNPDDISQRQVGRELRNRGLSTSNLNDIANDLGLY